MSLTKFSIINNITLLIGEEKSFKIPKHQFLEKNRYVRNTYALSRGNSYLEQRILILGAPNSGKKMVLEGITRDDIEFLCYNYEEIVLKNQANYLLRLSGGSQLSLIDEILDGDMDGIILVINNKTGLKETDQGVISLIEAKNIPYIIFANKQDLKSGNLINNTGAMVIPTIATKNIGINDGLSLLLEMIGQKGEEIQEPVSTPVIVNEMSPFCEVKVFLRTIQVENVKKALEKEGFSNLTITNLRFIDSSSESRETYRSYNHIHEYPEKLEMMLITQRDNIHYIREAIAAIITDDIDDEMFIKSVENVVRIRTSEKGENAID